MRTAPIVVWMALAIAAVTAIAFWDEQREAADTLDDFAAEQATIAQGAAAALRARVTHAAASDDESIETLRSIERPDATRVFVRRPGAGLVATDGRAVHSAPLEGALDRGAASVRLTRAEAAELGLPARMAMAGVVTVDAGVRGRWGVAVVGTALRARDRERRAQWRLALSVVLAAGLVVAFGSLALRKQRKELELSHALAIAELRRARDDRLVRADKLATMGAFATGIAHELSTPLGVIVARAEQLEGCVDTDERAKRAVAAIAEQATRIDGVMRGFLTLARGDAPAFEPAAPADLVAAALDLVEHRFSKAAVALTSEVAPDLPRISCEPRLIEQVLVNLLLNACDACGSGGAVALSVKRREAGVTFVVTDDGEGIPPEVAARATEPFFTTKPAGKGSGLGLAIASEIVKHHGGALALRSREGARGTTAEMSLPASSREKDAQP